MPSGDVTRTSWPRRTRTSRWAAVSPMARSWFIGSSSASLRFLRVQGSAAAAAKAVTGAGGRGLERLREPGLVVLEQLVHPCVGGVADRAVRGQQPRVGQREHQPQRAKVLAERRPRDGRLEADRRGDVRQHVVPGEQHGGRLVVEHDVAGGVPGGVDRAQRT